MPDPAAVRAMVWDARNLVDAHRFPTDGRWLDEERAVDLIARLADQVERSASDSVPRLPMRQTHTFATLEVSPAVFAEVKAKLEEAGYQHAFVDEAIDMHGIGLVAIRINTRDDDPSPPQGLPSEPSVNREVV